LSAQTGLAIASHQIATLADGSLVLVARLNALDPTADHVLFALRDANSDHTITIDELQIVWTYSNGDFDFTYRDFATLADGSVVALSDTGFATRLVDGNQDGSFTDDGETVVSYDAIFALANGQDQPGAILEVAAVAAGP
jgi:hypothetical protein